MSLQEERDKLATTGLSRTTLELALNSGAILDGYSQIAGGTSPTGIRISGDVQTTAWDEVLRRLAGFGVYCIREDLKTLEHMSHPTTLRELYDRSAVAALMRDEKALAFHEQLFGEVTLLNAHELERDKAGIARGLDVRIRAFEAFLKHPDAHEWNQRLLSERRPEGPPLSFLEMVGAGKRIKALKSKRVSFLEPLYRDSSGVIHGTTFDHWVETVGLTNQLIPAPGESSDPPSPDFDAVITNCTNIGLRLHLLRDRVWPAAT